MKRIPSLDGLRAISILLVIVGHLSERGIIPWKIWGEYANLGVRIFFVISGYLITQILMREQDATDTISLKNFYMRRSFRIFPAAIMFLGMATVVYWPELRWYHIATAFFYLANVGVTLPWFFGHLWSLSVEEQFYLLWPAILRRWRRAKVAILVSAMVLAPCVRLFLYAIHARPVHFTNFFANADALATGCLLTVIAPKERPIPSYLAFAMLVAATLIPLFEGSSVARTVISTVVLRPLLHVCIAGLLLFAVKRRLRFLNVGPLTWLGRISYSLYLWQQPFCFAPFLINRYIPMLAPVLACASYYLIEQPMLRLREKRYRDAAVVPEVVVSKVQANVA